MPDHRSVTLPVPTRMTLRNFSLYSRARTIEVAFEKSVFCLAGANGLGKSTFLSALNFAVTGTVAKPGTNFLGASKFYEDISGYSTKYFDGRISPNDHEIAEVEIELAVGTQRFHLTRGMFSPTGLRAFSITRENGETIDFSGAEVTDAERHGRYVNEIIEATGLNSFAQLVFLQWFVLTFDEQRHLLFWSDRISEQALFLAFGYSAESAERAEALQRAYDSSESKVRNLQWQATGVRKRLDALEAALGGESQSEDGDLEAEHQRMLTELDAAGAEHGELVASVQDAQARLDEAGIGEAAARQAYEEAFRERVALASAARLHPLVIAALEEQTCGICGTADVAVRDAVNDLLQSSRCPLCTSALSAETAEGAAALATRLTELGQRLVDAGEDVRSLREHVSRKVRALDEADARIRSARTTLETFRAANTRALLRGSGDAGVVDDARAGLRREIADLLQQKEQALQRRDQAIASLDVLRQDLGRRFAEMENEFVPLLQELAFEFLGVPLQVDLERRGHHLGLSLTLQGTQRPAADTLSESQRFFVDIALRMALARKLSSLEAPATLYIDTPEGSLDIAYEGRAGRMFGLFAGAEDHVIMTANINTSKLLLELATICRNEKMELVRMTEWSDLTSVQQDAQADFEAAYGDIEARLNGASN
ncbi:AAA family ATPase [Nocardioides bizhenqiangii]|uniref:Nuclease SbcCD subunit C n=1 Tax=Nocardioides bizhenqiangii TaxID=3095076 RepID=A0ABZ0ZSK9_9ACTN|nr:AAA family ATPase [Nocardioides sp. HM61]WQQ27277.1 AAA family ATPase [Nocardioides sp. HM61]